MRTGRKLSPWLVAYCLWISPALAQRQAFIRGFVLDKETGKPIPSVNVFYIPSSGGGTTTDSAGYFALRLPSGGSVVIVFSHIAYERVSKSINLDRQKTTELQLFLYPKTLGLGEVIVSAKRPFYITGAAERRARFAIGEDEFKKLGEVDMERAMKYLLPDIVRPLFDRMTRNSDDFTLYINGEWKESIFLADIDPRSVKRVLVWEMLGRSRETDTMPINLPLRRGNYVVLIETKAR